jgi:hypothetical protein
MIVVDEGPAAWFLLRDGERWLLDVNCSHSAVTYGWVMALTAQELADYEAGGRAFLDVLAADVHQTAPGVLGSGSPYRGRDLGRGLDKAVGAAVAEWRKRHPL